MEKVVKKMLALRALLHGLRGVEWLRRYAEILLHQALEPTAESAGKRCPAPGSTTKVSGAYSAATDAMGAVSKFI